ncbi:putative dolichyl-phosphate-mannose--protein mannosyltransferase SCDLUD_004639 [Saccharomycodes ludwigii]|uniref:putative dolichyl-phosphate-mannose--protein mannosyltransferase n=1 Tax=Saccharomycodes ludwigii TaxID=36035 RepID=UPI001E857CAE|nr:hypothetical protein SCDLUD_004639 [Saccharomycodes ludwigii]KAH3899208.1 hypothetical protein SCDLUD_004639 [Saccharomycodes ludwigii]
MTHTAIADTEKNENTDDSIKQFYHQGKSMPYFSITEWQKFQCLKTSWVKNFIILLFSSFLAIANYQRLLPLIYLIQSSNSSTAHFAGKDQILRPEEKILHQIGLIKEGVFHLNFIPPLGFTIFSILGRVDPSELSSLATLVRLRWINLIFSSATVFVISLTLMLVHNVNAIITIGLITLLTKTPIFIQESCNISLEMLEILSISLVLFNFGCYRKFGNSMAWILTCVFLGFSISIKNIGWMTYLLVGFVYLYDFSVSYMGDIKISNKCLFGYHLVCKTVTIIAIPLSILLGSYYYLFTTSFNVLNVPDFQLMTPQFQQTLLLSSNVINERKAVPDYINFLDTVLIRHVNSLGGHLHSHNFTYRSGSHEQQVTLYDFEDGNNEWVIEPASDILKKRVYADGEIVSVRRNDKVYLRHKITGKYLYLSPDHKPPINEREHDFEVSCRDWPANDTDSIANFRFSLDYDKDENDIDPIRSKLKPIRTKFQITANGGKICDVLSHDDRLPSWGFYQQEVLCVSPAVVDRTLFFIDDVVLPYGKGGPGYEMDLYEVPELNWFRFLAEYIYRSFRKDYTFHLIDQDIDVSLKEDSIHKWVIPWKIEDNHNSHNIVSGPIVYDALIALVLGLLVVSPIILFIRFWTWKLPKQQSHENIFLDNIIMKMTIYDFLQYDIIYSIGWALHFMIFNYSKHQVLSIKEYLPAFILLIHQAGILFQYVKNSKVLLGIIVSIGLVTYLLPLVLK